MPRQYTPRHPSPAGSTVTPMDSRHHRRVRMRLPARLRWTTPFGQKIELVNTIDVSRSGLLVSAKDPHTPGVTVSVTFPYDASLFDGQPEVLARVVRCEEVLEVIRSNNAREKVEMGSALEQERTAKLDQLARAIGIPDAPATFAVAFHFEEQTHNSSNGNARPREPERRGSMRRALAIPVRVHPQRIPWFEEAMAIDVSAKGMRFRTQRVFALSAKAHALCRNVDGHSLFKPGNSLRMHTDGNRQRPPHTAAPFRFARTGISVGGIVRLLFEMECDRESCRGIGDSDGTGKLIQFCGAFPFQGASHFNFLACVVGTNNLKHFFAPDHAGEDFRLAVKKRGIVRKGDRHRDARSVGILGGNKQAAARNVNRIY